MKSRIKPDSISLISVALIGVMSSFLVHYIPLMPHSMLIRALVVGLLCGAGASIVLRWQDHRMQQRE